MEQSTKDIDTELTIDYKTLTFRKALEAMHLDEGHLEFIAMESKNSAVWSALIRRKEATAQVLSILGEKVSPKDEHLQLAISSHENVTDDVLRILGEKTKYPSVFEVIVKNVQDSSWLGDLVDKAKDLDVLQKIASRGDDEIKLIVIRKLNVKKEGRLIISIAQMMSSPLSMSLALKLMGEKLDEVEE